MTNQASRHPAPITDESFRAAVRQLAAEQPEYVYTRPDPFGYNTCVYQYNGAPSCLIGQALHRLGVPVESLAAADNGAFERKGASTVLAVLAPGTSADTRAWAQEVQYHQDLGNIPWGEAVRLADELEASA